MARCQRGTSLVEALVACLVLALGVLGMGKLQGHLRLGADIARQRAQAVQLAQADMEGLRTFGAMAAGAAGPAYADVVSRSASAGAAEGTRSNTTFGIERLVTEGTGYRSAAIAVRWPDRTGQAQQVLLQSVIAATPPALAGALSVSAGGLPYTRVRGRAAGIPREARDLGDGSSVFKPSAAATIAYLFDNATGRITDVCSSGVAADTAGAGLRRVDLLHCTPLAAMLVSGIVRASLAAPPSAGNANDEPPPLDIALSLTGAAAADPPHCDAQRRSERGERFVAYHCVVASALGRWSGRTTVVPAGWRIGSSLDDRKVCRYSADQDGSGAVDSNAEHPNSYSNVDGPLMQQNFLIVRGDQDCPAADPGAPPLASLATVQHQP